MNQSVWHTRGMQRFENAEYFHAKQACYLCHQPHNVVDTEIQIEGEGVLCICRGCIGALAQTAGFDLTDRREEIERLRARADRAEGRLLIAERALEGVKQASAKLKV